MSPSAAVPLSVSSHLIPDCAGRPGDDPIFALNAQAKRRAAAGEDVLNSTLGALTDDGGDLAVMRVVFDAFRAVPPERAAAYAPISGPPEFLEAVRRDLFGDGPLLDLSVAAATPGGTGACHHAIVNFLEPGQRLLTTSYYWGPYGILANHTRRGLATFRMFDGAGRLDLEALDRALADVLDSQGRALVFLNSPCHNPTGYSMDEDDWSGVVERLCAHAKDAPVTVLLDFAYEKFAQGTGKEWLPHAEALVSRGVDVLIAWTASKAFTQYGARVGACVALAAEAEERDRIKNALGYSCRGTWSNCNHLGLLAIARILNDPELRQRADVERLRLRGLLDERVAAFNRLAGARGLRFPRYQGGFFVAVFTPDAEATAERMRRDGVFVVPLKGAVRVALCSTPVAAIPRLVEALAAGVAAAEARA